MRLLVCTVLLLCGFSLTTVRSHGFLKSPKSRNFLASTTGEERNYCPHCQNGGTVERVSKSGTISWSQGGVNGVCGDAFSTAKPRPHEAGGKFYMPDGVRYFETFEEGQVMNIDVTVTTNHNGRFEFRICRISGGYDEAEEREDAELTEGCLNEHVLKQADVPGAQNPGEKWFYTTPGDPITTEYSLSYQLPKDLSCDGTTSHCVLQWHWLTMNSCVPQDSPKQYRRPIDLRYCEEEGAPYPEEFWNCADIVIKPKSTGTYSRKLNMLHE